MTRNRIIESNTRPSIRNFKMTYWVKYLDLDYNGRPDLLSIKLHNNHNTKNAIEAINLALTSATHGFTYHFDPEQNRYTFRHHNHRVLDLLLGLKHCISYQTYYHAKVLFLYDGPSIVAKNP